MTKTLVIKIWLQATPLKHLQVYLLDTLGLVNLCVKLSKYTMELGSLLASSNYSHSADGSCWDSKSVFKVRSICSFC